MPGVQRTVKFIRYLEGVKKYVMSMDQDCYPDYYPLVKSLELPVADEVICRSGVFDVFGFLIRCQNAVVTFLKKNSEKESGTGNGDQAISLDVGSPKKNPITWLKDCISTTLTFPDFAYPWIFPAFLQGKMVVKKNNIDVVFATGMPWSSLIVGWMIKKSTGAKLVIDFRDPWVNNPYISGKGKLLRRVEQTLEKKIVESADKVILNTEPLRQDFVKRYQYLPENVFVTLLNGYDDFDFSQIQTNKTECVGMDLVLTHAGFLYGARDPKPIFEAIGLIREKGVSIDMQNMKFKQIGGINLNYDLDNYLKRNAFEENFQNDGQIEYRECLQRMVDSDILVIIQQDTYTQIPSKIYEYIYLNKPILTIAQKEGALGQLIEQYELGVIFPPDDIAGIADYLVQRKKEKEVSGSIEVEYKNRAMFDVQKITVKFKEIIDEVCAT